MKNKKLFIKKQHEIKNCRGKKKGCEIIVLETMVTQQNEKIKMAA